MKKIAFVFLLSLFYLSVNAQTKAIAKIKKFTIDSILHYKIKYTGNEISFQIEEFDEGKWNVITKISVESNDMSPLDTKIEENQIKNLKAERKYRLKIIFPIELMSKEAKYKK